MSPVSRRSFLSSGLVLSGSALIPRHALAHKLLAPAGALPEADPQSPREHLLFDFGWSFTLGDGCNPQKYLDFGYGQSDFSKAGEFAIAKVCYNDTAWRHLDLPHDWAVELSFEHDDTGKAISNCAPMGTSRSEGASRRPALGGTGGSSTYPQAMPAAMYGLSSTEPSGTRWFG